MNVDKMIKLNKIIKEKEKQLKQMKEEFIEYCLMNEISEVEGSLGKVKLIKKEKTEINQEKFWNFITTKIGKHKNLFFKIVVKLQLNRILKPSITECRKVFSEKEYSKFIENTGETYQVKIG